MGYSDEVRIEFARLLEGGLGYRKAAYAVGIGEKCGWSWAQLYGAGGLAELLAPTPPARTFPLETKLAAVSMFQRGATHRQVITAFGLRSQTTLEKWIARYRDVSDGAPVQRRSGRDDRLDVRKTFAAAVDEGNGYMVASRKVGIHVSTGWHWYQKYRRDGLLELTAVSKSHNYTLETKLAAVRAFEAGATRADVMKRFQLHGARALEEWVVKYRALGERGADSAQQRSERPARD